MKNMAVVRLEIPEELATFVMDNNKEEQLKRNAMMLYPYIHDDIISDTTPIISLLKPII